MQPRQGPAVEVTTQEQVEQRADEETTEGTIEVGVRTETIATTGAKYNHSKERRAN